MPSLRELQRALSAHIVAGDGPPLDAWIRVPAGADSAARIAVYTEGYPARVTEALRETYPALANILGDGSLAGLSDRYRGVLRDEPTNLNDVGADLPRFLRQDRLSEQLAFLPELAELEWAVTRSFHAAACDRFDPIDCKSWSIEDWQRAQIRFQPGLALLRSRWPLRALYATRNQDRDEIDVDLEQGGECVLVFRRGFEVAVEATPPREADAIEAFRAGATLAEVSEGLARDDALNDDVVELFQGWVSAGLIASVGLAEAAD
jgi:hypothetical protein